MPVTKKTQQGRRLERRRAIIQAAIEVFLEHGYGAARLEQIIQRSGGSLSTLYSEFKGKEGLFAAIIDEICDAMVGALPMIDAPSSESVEKVLHRFGLTYLRLLLAPVSLVLYRMVISESGRFPELGEAVFRAGPTAAADRLADYLREQARRGKLNVSDSDLTARLFLEMVKGDLHFRALIGAGAPPTASEVEVNVAGAVQTFLDGTALRSPRP